MPNPGLIRRGESPKNKLPGVLGEALGMGLGEFTGQYLANKSLDEVLNDPSLKDAPISERANKLESAMRGYGKRGESILQKRLQIEQQAEQEKVQGILAKYRSGKILTDEERASLPTKVQFDIEENERKKDEFAKKESEAANKEKTKVQDIVSIGRARGISDEDIFNHINQGGSVEGAKAAWEKPKTGQTDFSKKLHNRVDETIKQGMEFAPVLGQINSMEELIPKLKGISTIKANIPTTQEWDDASEFEAKSDTILGPLFKLYNPTGALPNAKVEMLRKRLKPNWYDTEGVQRAKLDALKFLGDAKVKQAKLFQEALYKYDNDPPDRVLLEIEKISDDALDAFDEAALEKGEIKFKGEKSESQSKESAPRADGKVKVKLKGGGGTGWVTPYAGMEEKYDLL